jgi:hypothetical protein
MPHTLRANNLIAGPWVTQLPTIRSRREAPVQLELAFHGRFSLRAVIGEHMSRSTVGLREATIRDYSERAEWILREFGESTDARELRLRDLEHVADKWRGIIRNVTIKKRLTFLRAALKLAYEDDVIGKVPALPRLQGDGQRKEGFHTVEQWRVFREYLTPGPYRRFYDLAFWTGHRTADVFNTRRVNIDPEMPIVDNNGEVAAVGAFYRRTQKTIKHRVPETWVPAQPELVELMREWLAEPGLSADPIVRPVTHMGKAFKVAAGRAIADGHNVPEALSPNDLRRSFASMLNERGYDPFQVQHFLGHKGTPPTGWSPSLPLAQRATIASTHYLRPTPTMMAGPRHPPKQEPSREVPHEGERKGTGGNA